MTSQRRWKGKERALEARDEGPGGSEGIVLPLELVGSGIYDVAYTLPVKLGSGDQQFFLQVDTGSSDMWIASASCSSQSCSQSNARLYNPSGSTATGVQFSIPYMQGSASGPVVWDSVTIGGYSIDNQAFAAASDVQDEPLEPKFNGILGLALPLNSIIATSLPPVTSNDADGAAWASNLFSITPSSSAPGSPFLSLSLSRPGFSQIPAQLGIGRHPSALVPDPSQILYSTLVSDKPGILFWKVNVRGITVYTNGQAQRVAIGKSVNGGVFPTAILDSGVPLIMTTSTIANAIYGAIGISPASDGFFYVPCKTPLNLTMTIDNRPEIPLHPLDLTTDPPDDNRADYCIGMIQVADRQLSQATSSIGDMILGVPFLRNVYTVMAYSPPSANGSFSRNQSLTTHINPRLGLMPLTNATQALQDFNTVRVLKQPLASPNATSGANDTKTVTIGRAKLSMGVAVLLGLLCFVALCSSLFLARYLLMRRRFRKLRMTGSDEGADFVDSKTAYQLVKKDGATGYGPLSEDQLRQIRYEAYKRNTMSTASSDRTRVESLSFGKIEDDFGLKTKAASRDNIQAVWDPLISLDWRDDTLVGRERRKRNVSDGASVVSHHSPPLSPGSFHSRQQSDTELPILSSQLRDIDIPLLSAHTHQLSLTDAGLTRETSALAVEGSPSETSSKEFPIPPPPLPSDRYYHTQRNRSRDNAPATETSPNLYTDSFFNPTTTIPSTDGDGDVDELGIIVDGSSMAGIGTASWINKLSRDSAFVHRDSLGTTRDSSLIIFPRGEADIHEHDMLPSNN